MTYTYIDMRLHSDRDGFGSEELEDGWCFDEEEDAAFVWEWLTEQTADSLYELAVEEA